jgi:hypothetical protein
MTILILPARAAHIGIAPNAAAKARDTPDTEAA